MTARDPLLQATVLDVLKRQGMTDVATIGGDEIDGYFVESLELAGDGDGQVAVGAPVFDCRAEDLPTGGLEENDEIEIEGHGTFRYVRSVPDSSGRTLLILGAIL